MKKILFRATLLVCLIGAGCGRMEGTTNSNIRPNAKRDLVLKKQQKKAVVSQGQVGSESEKALSFDLTNHSELFTYDRIDLDIYSYDKAGNKTDSTIYRVPVRLRPGKTERVNYDAVTLKNPGENTLDAVIRSADSE